MTVEILPCSHAFHAQCIEDIRSYGLTLTCPYCRTKLPKKALKKISDIESLLQKNNKDAKTLNTIRQLLVDAIIDGDVGALRQLQRNGINVNISLQAQLKPYNFTRYQVHNDDFFLLKYTERHNSGMDRCRTRAC